MNIFIIINDSPYGTERSYNGLRTAKALGSEAHVTVFLMADAVSCAKKGQNVPQGFYNIELMTKSILRHGGEILMCGTCMAARGFSIDEMIDGVQESNMQHLAEQTIKADKVLVF